MIVLANKQRTLVQAANDDVAVEKLSHAAATIVHLEVTTADTGAEHYAEPSAAAHMAALALWQQTPVFAPA